nr:MAG TPA: hypothetical protein [Caudoviricetes sp.]
MLYDWCPLNSGYIMLDPARKLKLHCQFRFIIAG